jgi:hypothetical protein
VSLYRHLAAISNGVAIRKGREFAAWPGLFLGSSGGKAELLGITKCGNVYLQKVLIHGQELRRVITTQSAISPKSGLPLKNLGFSRAAHWTVFKIEMAHCGAI